MVTCMYRSNIIMLKNTQKQNGSIPILKIDPFQFSDLSSKLLLSLSQIINYQGNKRQVQFTFVDIQSFIIGQGWWINLKKSVIVLNIVWITHVEK